ncbi:hypothetical protein SEVIR_3G164050v4 [Setaria viridis]|uniref:Uncharacterized protein n=1 Tax=Setaria viridis TaxID=4556 RepID=A0A4U6VBT5_SETVI|nr:hypothetical protein SEVIR_3G164050v2 [Setaria viridis]
MPPVLLPLALLQLSQTQSWSMEMEQWSSPMTFIRDAAASTCSLRCMPDAASAGPPARRTAACPAHAPRPPPPTSCARTPPAQAASVACCLRPHAAGAGSQGAAAQSECGKGPCSVRSESKLQLRWDVGGARASLPRRMGNGQQAAGRQDPSLSNSWRVIPAAAAACFWPRPRGCTSRRRPSRDETIVNRDARERR